MKTTGFMLLFWLLGTLFVGASELLFPQMPGMVSYTYRNSFQKDMASTLDTLQRLGVKDMEFSSLFGKKASEIKLLLDERDMYCSSFGVGYADLVERPYEVGQNAKELGARFVRVAWIPHSEPFNLEVAKKAASDFNRAGEILKKEFGLTFCYHNHGYEFYPYGDGTLMDYIIQQTNPEYVSFEIDILWTFFPGEDPVKLISKYPNRFKLLHLKDLRKGIKGDMSGKTATENDVALGEGQLDLPGILKAARNAGVLHYYIEDESPSYYLQVPRTIQYLKSLTY